ncbi:MAG: hypothetical protein ACRC5M_06705 [Anaeroplasmataceae bacterium]
MITLKRLNIINLITIVFTFVLFWFYLFLSKEPMSYQYGAMVVITMISLYLTTWAVPFGIVAISVVEVIKYDTGKKIMYTLVTPTIITFFYIIYASAYQIVTMTVPPYVISYILGVHIFILVISFIGYDVFEMTKLLREKNIKERESKK